MEGQHKVGSVVLEHNVHDILGRTLLDALRIKVPLTDSNAMQSLFRRNLEMSANIPITQKSNIGVGMQGPTKYAYGEYGPHNITYTDTMGDRGLSYSGQLGKYKVGASARGRNLDQYQASISFPFDASLDWLF